MNIIAPPLPAATYKMNSKISGYKIHKFVDDTNINMVFVSCVRTVCGLWTVNKSRDVDT